MPAPTLPTRDQFKSVTKIGLLKKRKNLEPIDRLLKEAELINGKMADQRTQLLESLIDACQAWIDKKDLKTQKLVTDGKEASQNTALRRVHVEKLFLQAVTRLNYEKFEARKAVNGPNAFQVKSLQPGYGPERQQFLNERTQARNAGQYGPGVQISPVGGGVTHEYAQFGGTGQQFTASTVQTYQQAYTWWKNNQASNNAVRVAFMRKNERLQHMVSIKDRRLYLHGKLMHHPAGVRGTMIYAMDCYGNLFAMIAESTNVRGQFSDRSNRDVLPGGDTVQLNHSALNAGNDVICAGTMEVNQGELILINNESGHYRPTEANLRECLTALQDDLVITENTKVRLMTDTGFLGPFRAGAFAQGRRIRTA